MARIVQQLYLELSEEAEVMVGENREGQCVDRLFVLGVRGTKDDLASHFLHLF